MTVQVTEIITTKTTQEEKEKDTISSSAQLEVRRRERLICSMIRETENNLRKEYSILSHQDLLGAFFFFGSILGIFALWYAYSLHSGDLNYALWIAVGVAILVSILHELEHDIIHNLYFRQSRWIQDTMFLFIWFFKLGFNPWFRRDIHLKHHIVSGQRDDAEERLIGLGLPFGWKRLAISVHSIGAPLDLPQIVKGAPTLNTNKMIDMNTPSTFLNYLLMKSAQIYLICFFLFGNSSSDFCSTGYTILCSYLPLLNSFWPYIRDFLLMLSLPNIIRQYRLVVMSNCSHYYGDIPKKSAMFQNQILDHWTVYPFQLFCFNFGATHIVHHYVPGQPFYLRQMVYGRVKESMIRLGVRYNDFGIVARANRFFSSSTETDSLAPSAPGFASSTSLVTEEDAYNAFVANPAPPVSSESLSLQVWLIFTVFIGLPLWYLIDSAIMITLLQRAIKRFILRRNPNE